MSEEKPPDNSHQLDEFHKASNSRLNEYYKTAMTREWPGAALSWVLAIAGLLMILAGIGSFNSGTRDASYLAAASGIITELVACVFFRMHNRTVRQLLTTYHDSFVDDSLLHAFTQIQSTIREWDRPAIAQKLIESIGKSGQSE